jgi:hypothetical protein
MYGDWIGPTEEEMALRKMAEEYNTRCDAYDRSVCFVGSPRSGEPMPINGYELGLVNRNARKVMDDLVRRSPYSLEQLHLEQLHKAIQELNK